MAIAPVKAKNIAGYEFFALNVWPIPCAVLPFGGISFIGFIHCKLTSGFDMTVDAFPLGANIVMRGVTFRIYDRSKLFSNVATSRASYDV